MNNFIKKDDELMKVYKERTTEILNEADLLITRELLINIACTQQCVSKPKCKFNENSADDLCCICKAKNFVRERGFVK